MIITDYYYIFSPKIRDAFFLKTKKELSKSIIIIDEGHNLPSRIRELMSERLTTNMILRAIKEAKKMGFPHVIEHLVKVQDAINKLSLSMKMVDEMLVKKDDFIKHVSQVSDFEQIISDLEFVASAIKEKQKQSYVGGIASFLNSWLGPNEGYSRVLTVKNFKKGPLTILSYRCLDPSLVSGPVIKESYSTIIMSGTLSPTETYKEILGFPESTRNIELKNPFPKKNRLNLIVPETSTKFKTRSKEQYQKIGKICAEVANLVPGNCAIFFPSYAIRDQVYPFFNEIYEKTIFLEETKLTKEEKNNLLEKFKKKNKEGSCLLAISAANFAEGVDLPGDLLKAVIVVGLPLQRPDLETKELINYYDDKYGAGWEYGYVFPAFTKTLQTAGRCIRDKEDRGVIVFLDERYAWTNYLKNFPKDWDMDISRDYSNKIKEFFKDK